MLKALCGGSNIDIDQQHDHRRRDATPWGGGSGSPSDVGHNARRGQHQQGALRGGVFGDFISKHFGGLDPMHVVVGAVALFVGLM